MKHYKHEGERNERNRRRETSGPVAEVGAAVADLPLDPSESGNWKENENENEKQKLLSNLIVGSLGLRIVGPDGKGN
jgi:hypothetical protein